MSRWYDLRDDGTLVPIDPFAMPPKSHVAPSARFHLVDEIHDSRISTVFLGLDHSFRPGAKPIVFETMVFGGPLDDGCVRYCTRDEAREGHAEMVRRVRHAYTLAPTLARAFAGCRDAVRKAIAR